MPIDLAQASSQRSLREVRKNGTLPYLRPDGKITVTVVYEEWQTCCCLYSSYLTARSWSNSEQIKRHHRKKVIKPVIHRAHKRWNKILHQPDRTFRYPVDLQGDSGLTGSNIMMIHTAGICCHGGGAFSGKDSTKVDRSACYAALRHAAKISLQAAIAKKCEVQLAYAIGVAKPTSILVDTHLAQERFQTKKSQSFWWRQLWPKTCRNYKECFDLRRPIYKQTAVIRPLWRDDESWSSLGKS